MFRPLNRIILILISTMAWFSQSTFADTEIATTKQQYGSYVILGQQPGSGNVAIARTVIDSSLLCPTVLDTATNKQTSMISRDNPNKFPVIVCEALIDFDVQYQLQFSDGPVELPMAKSDPVKIQVFGDTGCKTKDCPSGSAASPFKSLAKYGARSKPDLVLHMGDYNYRGTGGQIMFTDKNTDGQLAQQGQWPYDAGDDLTQAEHCGQNIGAAYYSQSALNANKPDIWSNWHDDLFRSAKKLMAAAPWIVARGNHELCSRAGPGYFYFLDPSSNLIAGGEQMSCKPVEPQVGPIGNFVQRPNYKVSFKKLDVAVIDSTNACDGFADSPFTAVYQQVFSDLNTMVTNNNTWLVTHRPIWAVQSYDADKSTGCTSDNQFSCINQMMQKAISAQPGGVLPAGIKAIFTGHMHKFESVSFTDGTRPPNIIVGSSGVALSGDAPAGGAQVKVDGKMANVLSTNTQVSKKSRDYDAFGFMKIELDNQGGWQGTLVNPARSLTLAECSSKQNLAQGVCELAKGVSVTD